MLTPQSLSPQVASKDYPATSPAFTGPFYRRHRRHVGRHKRHLLRLRRATGGSLGASSDLTNEQLILYLQPGLWFLSLVNDQPSPRRLNLTVYEASELGNGVVLSLSLERIQITKLSRPTIDCSSIPTLAWGCELVPKE